MDIINSNCYIAVPCSPKITRTSVRFRTRNRASNASFGVGRSSTAWCAPHSLLWVVCGSGQKACFSLDCIDDKTKLTSGANNGGWSRTNKSLDYIDGNTNFTSGKTNGGACQVCQCGVYFISTTNCPILYPDNRSDPRLSFSF